MSSAEIMAMIKVKEAEREQLIGVKRSVEIVNNAVSCATAKFAEAGELIAESGNIGGQPFDGGRTTETAGNLSNISAQAEGVIGSILGAISALDSEIAQLYAAYYAALAAEEEARRIAEAAAANKKK